jgi:hypothetical protein
VKRLGDNHARRNHEQRVAIRRRSREFAQGRFKGGARPVFDVDVGVQAFSQLLRNQPRGHIGCSAGHQSNNDAYRLGGEILRLGGLDMRRNKRNARKHDGNSRRLQYMSHRSLPARIFYASIQTHLCSWATID